THAATARALGHHAISLPNLLSYLIVISRLHVSTSTHQDVGESKRTQKKWPPARPAAPAERRYVAVPGLATSPVASPRESRARRMWVRQPPGDVPRRRAAAERRTGSRTFPPEER